MEEMLCSKMEIEIEFTYFDYVYGMWHLCWKRLVLYLKGIVYNNYIMSIISLKV